MKHPSNRDLFLHWNERRGERLAPERGDIDPAAIRQSLGDTFVLALDSQARHPFRLAGTRLCALFGRELKSEGFVTLWEDAAQTSIRELVAVVTEEKTGIVASVTATVAADPVLAVNMELLLLPLAHENRAEQRVLGAMGPMAAPYWLGTKPVGGLRLGMFRHVGPVVDDAPVVAAASGRLRNGWTVYQGGRAD